MQPQVCIVLADMDFSHSIMLSEIAERLPNTQLVGCTTAGNFSSDFGFSEDSISVILFSSDTIEIRTAIATAISRDPIVAAQQALRAARQAITQTEKLCLVFPDGAASSSALVVAEISHRMDEGCTVIGGSTERNAMTREAPKQFYGTEVFQDGMPIVLFAGPLKYTFRVCNSWQPIGNKSRVVANQDGSVERIGSRKALDFYQHYLGRHQRPAFEFPRAVHEHGEAGYYIRVPTAYDEAERNITFAAAIPSGATVPLAEATPERIFSETGKSADAVNQTLCWRLPVTLARAYSALARYWS